MISYLDNVKENVYILSGLEESPKYDLKIESLVREILAYCYRDDLIEAMVLPVSEVIASNLQTSSMVGLDGNVASYKEGDMQVSFSSDNTSQGKVYFQGKLEAFKLIRGLADV